MSEQKQIEEWFHQYSDDIYQYLLYRLNTTDVEDFVQEVFIKALKGLRTFKGDASGKTWLYSIATNVATDEWRRRKREKWKALLLFEATNQQAEYSSEELYFLSEEHKEIVNTIHKLKTAYQDVLIMRGMKELTVSETAEALGWSEEKVRSTHYRAKQALQNKLGGERE